MIPLVDGHLDLAWNAVDFERDLTLPVEQINAAEQGYADSAARGGAVVSLAEMRCGGVWLCFGTLLARTVSSDREASVDPSRINLDYRQAWGAGCAAHAQFAWYQHMAAIDQIRLIRTAEQLDAFWTEKQSGATNAIGVILVMEGADPIANAEDLANWFDLGLRQLNLVHYGTNRYAGGTGAEGGLTNAGRKLLDRCARWGVALDTTHLSDRAFFEATDHFAGPLLASHQNCRALVDGQRQFTDEQLQIVIARGGIIGAAMDNWMLHSNWKTGVTPRGAVTLEHVADHIDHVCQLAGHHRAAAIGTDLDGGFGRTQAPSDVNRIGDVQALAPILAERGYSDSDIRAIFHDNWLRLLRFSLPSIENGAVSPPTGTPTIPAEATSPRPQRSSWRRPTVQSWSSERGQSESGTPAASPARGARSVALCDLSPSRLEEVASRIDVVGCFSDFNQVLDASPTAAVIATPAPFHVEQAIQLLEHGVPVLIEKPLSTTLEGVAQLTAAAKQTELPVAVAYVLRFHPVLSELKRSVADGRIGNPLQVVLQSGQCFPFFRPAYRDTYYTRRATGGGAVQDALTHFVNAVEWIVGPSTAVQADGANLALDGVEVEDTVNVLARHGDILASYTLNQHQAANETTLTVIGDRGMIRGQVGSNTIGVQTSPKADWEMQSLPPLERDDLFLAQAEAFLDCVENKTPPACSLAEATATLATQIAILDAIDRPEWKRIEQASNRFVPPEGVRV